MSELERRVASVISYLDELSYTDSNEDLSYIKRLLTAPGYLSVDIDLEKEDE